MKYKEAKKVLIEVYQRTSADTLNFKGDKGDHMGISVPYGVVKKLAKRYLKMERRSSHGV